VFSSHGISHQSSGRKSKEMTRFSYPAIHCSHSLRMGQSYTSCYKSPRSFCHGPKGSHYVFDFIKERWNQFWQGTSEAFCLSLPRMPSRRSIASRRRMKIDPTFSTWEIIHHYFTIKKKKKGRATMKMKSDLQYETVALNILKSG
jgi:hypothetical protein